ncbi:MAG: orotate phosphoribosyltransferase [Oscillospiraceae bacterium]|nr:orotate phosphoribosyltransferase [Oscillospiraceae bacterium]
MSQRRVLYAEFLDFMVECGALLFGDFTLKSGRKSPYFINTGEYKTGAQLSRLGDFYTKLIHNSVRAPEDAGTVGEKLDDLAKTNINNLILSKFNVLFGPAYKGIPLVTATSVKLASDGLSLDVSFNRKERKDHGEGNLIMGYFPQAGDRIAIIEDVTTAGTSVRETVALLDELGIDAKVVALYISVDRMERGAGNSSAINQLEQEYGIDVYSIATAADIIDYLENTPDNCAPIANANAHAANIREYLTKYGALLG